MLSILFLAAAVAGSAQNVNAQSCLEHFWRKSPISPDIFFDVAHDRYATNRNLFISCFNFTTASLADKARTELQAALRRGDREAVIALIGFPLIYRPLGGEGTRLSRSELLRRWDEVFSAEIVEMILNLTFEDLRFFQGSGQHMEMGPLIWNSRVDPWGSLTIRYISGPPRNP